VTIHFTWWWLIYGGAAVWVIGTIAGMLVLSVADDWWLWPDLAIVLFWPVFFPVMFVIGIGQTLWEHRGCVKRRW
jgi:hypothetical protein